MAESKDEDSYTYVIKLQGSYPVNDNVTRKEAVAYSLNKLSKEKSSSKKNDPKRPFVILSISQSDVTLSDANTKEEVMSIPIVSIVNVTQEKSHPLYVIFTVRQQSSSSVVILKVYGGKTKCVVNDLIKIFNRLGARRVQNLSAESAQIKRLNEQLRERLSHMVQMVPTDNLAEYLRANSLSSIMDGLDNREEEALEEEEEEEELIQTYESLPPEEFCTALNPNLNNRPLPVPQGLPPPSYSERTSQPPIRSGRPVPPPPPKVRRPPQPPNVPQRPEPTQATAPKPIPSNVHHPPPVNPDLYPNLEELNNLPDVPTSEFYGDIRPVRSNGRPQNEYQLETG